MKKQEKEVSRTVTRAIREVHRALFRVNRPEFQVDM